jgi:hypothetical protein
LYQVYGGKKIRGCTIFDVPPFFGSAGREESVVPMSRDMGCEGSSSTLDLQTGVVSTEDTDEIWESAKEETMEKVRDETEVKRSFCLNRTDGWVINRKTKKIILLEYEQNRDIGECYFQDMWKVSEKQHTPILTGLRSLRKGVSGNPRDLWDWEGGWEKDHR